MYASLYVSLDRQQCSLSVALSLDLSLVQEHFHINFIFFSKVLVPVVSLICVSNFGEIHHSLFLLHFV